MLRSSNAFTLVANFDKEYGNISFHGNLVGDTVSILLVKNVLLTFQIEQN